MLDLNDVVAEVESMLRRLIGEQIQLVTVFQEGLGRVKADATQVEQVLLNLCVNARDAMPEGGKLLIETADVELDQAFVRSHRGARPGRYVMLAVVDTGHGLDSATMARVFEPFFTTKQTGKGTGLGLATVYGIVKQSGGYIEVRSEPGRGSAFRVYLPRTGDEDPAALETGPVEPPASGGETILLVEDEGPLRLLLRGTLEEGGYTVADAGSPEEATSLWIGRLVSLVLRRPATRRAGGGWARGARQDPLASSRSRGAGPDDARDGRMGGAPAGSALGRRRARAAPVRARRSAAGGGSRRRRMPAEAVRLRCVARGLRTAP